MKFAVSLVVSSYFAVLVLLLLFNTCDAALDFKKLLKRRPMSSRKITEADLDAESSAEKARKYHTACDQELARSLVILGEQKEQSEAALDLCKSQREKALENAEFLSKKVEVVTMSLDESENRCNSKLHDERVEYDTRRAELEAKLESIWTEHEEETNSLLGSHRSTLEELQNRHKEEIASLNEANKANLTEIRKEKEELLSKIEKVRAAAKEREGQILATHKSELTKLEAELTSSQNSLSETIKARDKLESNYERSLKQISDLQNVLENVTAYTLAVEEAKNFAVFAQKLVSVIINPLYDKHLKRHLEAARKIKDQAHAKLEPVRRSMGRMKPKLEPVFQPISTEHERLKSSIQNGFDEASSYLTKSFCTRRADLEEWENEHKLDAYISTACDEVCSNPDEFLATCCRCILILLAWLFRRFILRAILAVLVLPMRLCFLPFIFLRKSRQSKVTPSKKHP